MDRRALAYFHCVLGYLLLAIDRPGSWPGTICKLHDWRQGCGQWWRSGDGWLVGEAGRACGAGLLVRARDADDLGRDDGGVGVRWAAGSGGRGWQLPIASHT